MGNWGYGGWGMMGHFGWIGSLLFLVLIVLGIVYLWRALDLGQSLRQGSGDTSGRSNKALDIARERYARGEISKEEFEQLKRDLS
jgi:putative membrane protein